MRAPRRGEVHLVSLDPTRGGEIQRTRPCLIVSPDDLNEHLGTYIVAPMTTGGHPYPFRVAWMAWAGTSALAVRRLLREA